MTLGNCVSQRVNPASSLNLAFGNVGAGATVSVLLAISPSPAFSPGADVAIAAPAEALAAGLKMSAQLVAANQIEVKVTNGSAGIIAAGNIDTVVRIIKGNGQMIAPEFIGVLNAGLELLWPIDQNPAPQNVTIPVGTVTTLIFISGFLDGVGVTNVPTMTLGGRAPDQSIVDDGAGGALATGAAFAWHNPPTGVQALTLAWSDGDEAEGPPCVMLCLKGNQTPWEDADAMNAEAADPVSVTLTTTPGDMVFKFDSRSNATPPGTSAGWTNLASTSDRAGMTGNLSYIIASGASTVCAGENEDQSVVVAVAFSNAPGA